MMACKWVCYNIIIIFYLRVRLKWHHTSNSDPIPLYLNRVPCFQLNLNISVVCASGSLENMVVVRLDLFWCGNLTHYLRLVGTLLFLLTLDNAISFECSVNWTQWGLRKSDTQCSREDRPLIEMAIILGFDLWCDKKQCVYYLNSKNTFMYGNKIIKKCTILLKTDN